MSLSQRSESVPSSPESKDTVHRLDLEGSTFNATRNHGIESKNADMYSALLFNSKKEAIESLMNYLDDQTIFQFIANELEVFLSRNTKAEFLNHHPTSKKIWEKLQKEFSHDPHSAADKIKRFCLNLSVCIAFLKFDVASDTYKTIIVPNGGVLDAIARIKKTTLVIYRHESSQYSLQHTTYKANIDLKFGDYTILACTDTDGLLHDFYQLSLSIDDQLRFNILLNPWIKDSGIYHTTLNLAEYKNCDKLYHACLESLVVHYGEDVLIEAHKGLYVYESFKDQLLCGINSPHHPNVDSIDYYTKMLRIWRKDNVPHYNFICCYYYYQNNPSLALFFSHLAHHVDPHNLKTMKIYAEELIRRKTNYSIEKAIELLLDIIEQYETTPAQDKAKFPLSLNDVMECHFHLNVDVLAFITLRLALTSEKHVFPIAKIIALTAFNPDTRSVYSKAITHRCEHVRFHSSLPIFDLINDYASLTKELLAFAGNTLINRVTLLSEPSATSLTTSPAPESKAFQLAKPPLPFNLSSQLFNVVTSFLDEDNWHSLALTSKANSTFFREQRFRPIQPKDQKAFDENAIKKVIDEKISLINNYAYFAKRFDKEIIELLKQRLLLLINMGYLTIEDIKNHNLVPLIFLAMNNNKHCRIYSPHPNKGPSGFQTALAYFEHEYCCALVYEDKVTKLIKDAFNKVNTDKMTFSYQVDLANSIQSLEAETNFAQVFNKVNFRFVRHLFGKSGYSLSNILNFLSSKKYTKQQYEQLTELLTFPWFDLVKFSKIVCDVNFNVTYFLEKLIKSQQHLLLTRGLITFHAVADSIMQELKLLKDKKSDIDQAEEKFPNEVRLCKEWDLIACYATCLLPKFAVKLNEGLINSFTDFAESITIDYQLHRQTILTSKLDFSAMKFEIMKKLYDAKDENTREFKQFHACITKVLDKCAECDLKMYSDITMTIKAYQPYYANQYLSTLSKALTLKNAIADLESKHPTSEKMLAKNVFVTELTAKLDKPISKADIEEIIKCWMLLKDILLRTDIRDVISARNKELFIILNNKGAFRQGSANTQSHDDDLSQDYLDTSSINPDAWGAEKEEEKSSTQTSQEEKSQGMASPDESNTDDPWEGVEFPEEEKSPKHSALEAESLDADNSDDEAEEQKSSPSARMRKSSGW